MQSTTVEQLLKLLEGKDDRHSRTLRYALQDWLRYHGFEDDE